MVNARGRKTTGPLVPVRGERKPVVIPKAHILYFVMLGKGVPSPLVFTASAPSFSTSRISLLSGPATSGSSKSMSIFEYERKKEAKRRTEGF